MLASQPPVRSAVAAERDAWPKLRPARTYKIYTGRSGVNARGVGYLTWPTEEVAKLDKYLRDLEQKLGDVTFIGGETIPPTDVAEVAATLDKLFTLGVPAVLFFQPFSGHGWMYFQQ